MVIAADISSGFFDPRPLRAATLALLPSVIGRHEVSPKNFWPTVRRAAQIAEDAKSQAELTDMLEEFVRAEDFQQSTRHFAELFFSRRKTLARSAPANAWPNLSAVSAARISFGVSMFLEHSEIFQQADSAREASDSAENFDFFSVIDSSDTPLPISSLLTRSLVGSAAMLALSAKSNGISNFSVSREEHLALLWRRGVVSLLTIAALSPNTNVQKRAVSARQRENVMKKVSQWQTAIAAFRAMPVTQVAQG
jgi:hypothetical protein